MKKMLIFLLALSLIAPITGCGKGEKVNGHNTNTAYRSLKGLRKYLQPDKRLEFEIAFGIIRETLKNDDDFLDAVDGKKPEEIIALGKETYQKNKNSNVKGYEQYKSWEEMIAKFGRERVDQENSKVKKKEENRDKANDVMYKL